jgi:predicted nucleic acid-binding Zn ribbon protein
MRYPCEFCGRVIDADNTKRKFCSDDCYKEVNRIRERERKKINKEIQDDGGSNCL